MPKFKGILRQAQDEDIVKRKRRREVRGYRMRFSYFPGCTDHSTSIEYGMSIHEVFKTLGVELVEIEDWNCCGAAATHSINHLLSLCLPARNISKAQRPGRTPGRSLCRVL